MGPSPEFRFKVTVTPTGVTAVADGAVRFPDPARAELKRQLRTAVAEIPVGPEDVLRGSFAGALPPNSKTDVENRVLLNIGLADRCLRRGFAFEHQREPPPGWTCGYDYRTVDADTPFDLWCPRELLAGWNDLDLHHGLTAAAVWWALRTTRDLRLRGPAAPVPATMLKTTVASPRPLTLNEIKAVADGVVAAAQWTRTIHPRGVDRLVANLARVGIVTNRDVVVDLLQDPRGAGAGHCRGGLIAKDGRVDPDDHWSLPGSFTSRTRPHKMSR